MSEEKIEDGSAFSRRDFIRTAALGAAAITAGCAKVGKKAAAVDDRKLRIGLVGCGGRGRGAVLNIYEADKNVELVAAGDLFGDQVDGAVKLWAEKLPQLNLPVDRRFTGWDAYRQVIDSDVDIIILATPPGFRPMHLRYAVERGRHIFSEKPVCVDAVGARSVLETAAMADTKGLCIVTGTQRRHSASYLEMMRRIEDGAIGEVIGGQCYWNQEGLWVKKQQPSWSDMEWQCRNWLYFDWLSGDHIVEQHVHNIDVLNWALGGPPVKATGVGGRQQRTAPEYGNIYDHFAVEFEYANGARVLSMCRQIVGSNKRVGERIVGTKGVADGDGRIVAGRRTWEAAEDAMNPYVQEHIDLIAAIRRGEKINELRTVTDSCLTAIMGRMAAYTGREVSMNWLLNASKLDLMPKNLAFGPNPVSPVPVPGQAELV